MNDQTERRKATLFPKQQKVLRTLGENIKLARKRRQLTQKLIGERTGISPITLRKIEKGDAGVSIGHYLSVLAALKGRLLINPVTPAHGLHLNITESDNQLDFALAMEVADYFRVKTARATTIQQEVRQSVSRWANKAKAVGINRAEQERMAQAFRF
jgi:transcriptional regulator with XRE-family HTH domain